MTSRTGRGATYVALGLAAAVAARSGLYHATDTQQEWQWLLLTSVAPEAAATAGTVGDSPAFPVPLLFPGAQVSVRTAAVFLYAASAMLLVRRLARCT
jgi:hypothetical protein